MIKTILLGLAPFLIITYIWNRNNYIYKLRNDIYSYRKMVIENLFFSISNLTIYSSDMDFVEFQKKILEEYLYKNILSLSTISLSYFQMFFISNNTLEKIKKESISQIDKSKYHICEQIGALRIYQHEYLFRMKNASKT
jgi:hypothetical protein